ncbi:MAG: DUF805 domain-containing protein [Halomonas sp.]|nr:DUF805 domain-containing protein [Halomonas sp.]MBR2514274.1 DUF805 domain-containing protein [Halomonas sp.]
MNQPSQLSALNHSKAKKPRLSLDISNSLGRLGRLRFLKYSLLIFIIWAAIASASNILWNLYYTGWHEALSLFMIFVSIIASVMGVIFCTRRLNDFNATGWWMLIFFVPIATPIMLLLMLLLPGTKGENRFGPAPQKNSKFVYVTVFLMLTLLFIAATL